MNKAEIHAFLINLYECYFLKGEFLEFFDNLSNENYQGYIYPDNSTRVFFDSFFSLSESDQKELRKSLKVYDKYQQIKAKLPAPVEFTQDAQDALTALIKVQEALPDTLKGKLSNALESLFYVIKADEDEGYSVIEELIMRIIK
jgi:putative heme degradation protein